jgi:hypothetical protein
MGVEQLPRSDPDPRPYVSATVAETLVSAPAY